MHPEVHLLPLHLEKGSRMQKFLFFFFYSSIGKIIGRGSHLAGILFLL